MPRNWFKCLIAPLGAARQISALEQSLLDANDKIASLSEKNNSLSQNAELDRLTLQTQAGEIANLHDQISQLNDRIRDLNSQLENAYIEERQLDEVLKKIDEFQIIKKK